MVSPVSLLRSKLTELNVTAYFLPHNDAHNNEYLALHDMRMPYLSGFKGSSGHLLVTQDSALLWTDGRYWLAAEKELFPGWTLMKLAEGVPKYYEWVEQNLQKGSVIAYDPYILTADSVKLRKEYFENKGYQFLGLPANPVNEIWTDRPHLSSSLVIRHEDQYAGQTFKEKLNAVLETMTQKFLFTNALDEIAWLLNLRGKDIEFNPVFFSYLAIEKHDPPKVSLFINESKIENVKEYLQSNDIEIYGYDKVGEFLERITEGVLVDPSKCNYAFYQKISQPVSNNSIISNLKAVKNPREIQGFRESHLRDGLAVCKYLAWLEQELKSGNEWTEYTASNILEQYRSQEDLNMGLSFGTISSVGENAAIIHYKPEESKASVITSDKIYLLDSGGQYLDGTTDTTRTVHFGNPTDWEKECYTRVLLGNLDLERVVWPNTWGVSGAELDILARRRLWEKGLDYNHGTGHGVGYYLNVHEGPQGISRARKVTLKPGMSVTNEPGYYEPKAFGIRIENLMFVRDHPIHKKSLCFENVTMVPYDKNLIKTELLTEPDKKFINEYHSKIWEKHSKVLEQRNDKLTLSWLERQVSPLI
jgi:Xaa-Pro aminopeptidase